MLKKCMTFIFIFFSLHVWAMEIDLLMRQHAARNVFVVFLVLWFTDAAKLLSTAQMAYIS